LKLLLKTWEILWEMITSQLNPSSTNKMIAKIIHPRLLCGRMGGGGVMTGGGVKGGGTPGEEKGGVSITNAN
jgi:hypothetical protein